MIGQVYARQNDHRAAVRSFYRIIRGSEADQYPSSQPWKPAATYQAGRSFESLHNIDQAKRLYREVVEKYPHSESAAAAKERIAVLDRYK
jgi:TolA-binding protein